MHPIAVPLQQRYGALPVLLHAHAASLVLVLPVGIAQIPGSTWSWVPHRRRRAVPPVPWGQPLRAALTTFL